MAGGGAHLSAVFVCIVEEVRSMIEDASCFLGDSLRDGGTRIRCVCWPMLFSRVFVSKQGVNVAMRRVMVCTLPVPSDNWEREEAGCEAASSVLLRCSCLGGLSPGTIDLLAVFGGDFPSFCLFV